MPTTTWDESDVRIWYDRAMRAEAEAKRLRVTLDALLEESPLIRRILRRLDRVVDWDGEE
jgi:hypothetical protein